MPHSIRTFCIALCVALMASLSLHASAQAQHEIGHSAGWPPIAISADDDHGHAHRHVAPVDSTPDSPQPDQDTQPTGHHHGGVEKSSPLPVLQTAEVAHLGVVGGHQPSGTLRLDDAGVDGPDYPPKRTRAIL